MHQKEKNKKSLNNIYFLKKYNHTKIKFLNSAISCNDIIACLTFSLQLALTSGDNRVDIFEEMIFLFQISSSKKVKEDRHFKNSLSRCYSQSYARGG